MDNSYEKYSNNCDDDEYIEEPQDIDFLGDLKSNIEAIQCTKGDLKELINSYDVRDKEKLATIVNSFIQYNRLKNFFYLISNNYKIDVLNNMGQTILHLAFYQDFPTDLIKKCLDNKIRCKKSKYIDYIDCNGLSHFHIACSKSTIEDVEKFIENDSNVNANFHFDPCGRQSGFKPLHFALTNEVNSEKIVKALIAKGADPNAVDVLGRSPLHLACGMFQGSESLRLMKLFLDNNSNPNLKDNLGNTPLHSIFLNYHEEFKVRPKTYYASLPLAETKSKSRLLLSYGADLAATNNDENTILHLIIKKLQPLRFLNEDSMDYFNDSVHINIIKDIINANSKIELNKKNNQGETALSLAVSFMSNEIIKILLDNGASVDNLRLIERDEKLFIYPNNIPNFKAVQNITSIFELLLNKGFKITLKDNLKVLKFLVHNISYCSCHFVNMQSSFYNYWEDTDNQQVIIHDLINYGSATHILSVLNSKKSDRLVHYTAMYQLNIKKNLGFYIDPKLLEYMKHHHGKYPDMALRIDRSSELKNADIAKNIMKKTELEENITLYDVIQKSPYDIYPFLQYINFKQLKRSNFNHNYSLKGHVIQSLIRHYVEESAYDYLRKIFPPLTNICCKQIFQNLNNEDILNICLAVIPSN